MFIFIDGSISWMSGKETIVIISTMEAKFIFCSEPISYGL